MDTIIQKKKIYQRPLFWILITVPTTIILYLIIDTPKETLKIKKDYIQYSLAEYQTFQEYFTVQGNVLPIKSYFLDAIEGGTVQEIFVEDGQVLKKGDPILKLENTNLLMDIMYREAELFEQSNNLRNTRLQMEQNTLNLKNQILESNYQLLELERTFNRNQELFKKKFISNEENEKSKENLIYMREKNRLSKESMRIDSLFRLEQIKQIESSIRRMRDNLEFVKSKLENLTLSAPADGQLTSFNAELGELKQAGSRIGILDNIEEYKIQALVDEHYLQRITKGTKCVVENNGSEFKAEIIKIYPQINNSQFTIDVKLEDNSIELRRGQTFNIRIELGSSNRSLVIKRGSFFNTTGGNWIYVLESDEVAEKREIKLGRVNSDYFEVISGLKEGDKVIVSSYSNYNDTEILKLN